MGGLSKTFNLKNIYFYQRLIKTVGEDIRVEKMFEKIYIYWRI